MKKKRKRPLLSWANTDYPTRIRANVSIKHVFSMNFTHFHELFLHQVFSHCNRPIGPKYARTEKNNTGQRFHGKTLCILINSCRNTFRTCNSHRIKVLSISNDYNYLRSIFTITAYKLF